MAESAATLPRSRINRHDTARLTEYNVALQLWQSPNRQMGRPIRALNARR
jgi:hypothetical protein